MLITSNRKDLFWAGAIAVVFLLLLSIQLGRESFWTDEVHTITATRMGIWKHLTETEASPPLSFVVYNLWSALFGESHVALRSLPVIFGALGVGCLFLTLRVWNISRLFSVMLCLWFALHPIIFFQARQCRYYSLFALLLILWLGALGKVIHSPEKRFHPGYIAAGLLAFSTHYYFIFCWAAVMFAGLLMPCLRIGRTIAKKLIVNNLILGAAMLVWVPLIVIQHDHGPSGYLDKPGLGVVLDTYLLTYLHGTVESYRFGWYALAVLILGIAGFGLHRSLRNRPGTAIIPGTVVLFSVAVLSNLLPFIVSIVWQPIYYPERYSMMFLPAFLLAIGYPAQALPRIASRALPMAMAIIIMLNIPRVYDVVTKIQIFDWRESARLIDEEWQQGDVMVFHPGWLANDYGFNGGEYKNVAGANEWERIMQPGRVWLFLWEQAPDLETVEPLLKIRADQGHPFLLKWPSITLSRIEITDSSAVHEFSN